MRWSFCRLTKYIKNVVKKNVQQNRLVITDGESRDTGYIGHRRNKTTTSKTGSTQHRNLKEEQHRSHQETRGEPRCLPKG